MFSVGIHHYDVRMEHSMKGFLRAAAYRSDIISPSNGLKRSYRWPNIFCLVIVKTKRDDLNDSYKLHVYYAISVLYCLLAMTP